MGTAPIDNNENIDGKLVEVFNKRTKSDDSENQMINDEFRKWENLNYHGTN